MPDEKDKNELEDIQVERFAVMKEFEPAVTGMPVIEAKDLTTQALAKLEGASVADDLVAVADMLQAAAQKAQAADPELAAKIVELEEMLRSVLAESQPPATEEVDDSEAEGESEAAPAEEEKALPPSTGRRTWIHAGSGEKVTAKAEEVEDSLREMAAGRVYSRAKLQLIDNIRRTYKALGKAIKAVESDVAKAAERYAISEEARKSAPATTPASEEDESMEVKKQDDEEKPEGEAEEKPEEEQKQEAPAPEAEAEKPKLQDAGADWLYPVAEGKFKDIANYEVDGAAGVRQMLGVPEGSEDGQTVVVAYLFAKDKFDADAALAYIKEHVEAKLNEPDSEEKTPEEKPENEVGREQAQDEAKPPEEALKMQCTNCGSTIPPAAKFCPECGASKADMLAAIAQRMKPGVPAAAPESLPPPMESAPPVEPREAPPPIELSAHVERQTASLKLIIDGARVKEFKNEHEIASALTASGEPLTAYKVIPKGDSKFIEGTLVLMTDGERRDGYSYITAEAIHDLAASGRADGADIVFDHPSEEEQKQAPMGTAKSKVGKLIGKCWTDIKDGAVRLLSKARIWDSYLVRNMAAAQAAECEDAYEPSYDIETSGVRVEKDGRIRRIVSKFGHVYNWAMVSHGAVHGVGWERQVASMQKKEKEAMAGNTELTDTTAKLVEATQKAEAVALAKKRADQVIAENGFNERDTASAKAWIAENLTKDAEASALDPATIEKALMDLREANEQSAPSGEVVTEEFSQREKAGMLVEDWFTPEKPHRPLADVITRYNEAVTGKRVAVDKSMMWGLLGATGRYLKGLSEYNNRCQAGFIEDEAARKRAAFQEVTERINSGSLGQFKDEREKAAILTAGLGEVCADRMHKIMHRGYKLETEGTGPMHPGIDLVVAAADKVAANDFKNYRFVNLAESALIPAIAEGAPYTELAANTDLEETGAITLYGMERTISEQAAKDDDIGILDTIPDKDARSYGRRLYRTVWDLMLNNTAMSSDALALYHANHGTNRNTNAYTFAQFITTLTNFSTQVAYSMDAGANREHLHQKPKSVVASVAVYYSLLRDLSLPTNPIDTNRSANQVVIAYGNLEIYGMPPWDSAGTTDRVCIFGDPNDCPIIGLLLYEGKEAAEIFIADDPAYISSNAKIVKTRGGHGVAIIDYRNTAAHVV